MLDQLTEFHLRLTPEAPLGCAAWLVGCGLNAPASAGYRHRGDAPSARGRSILQYTLAGRGYLDFRGVYHRIGPGQAMLLQPPDDYVYAARDGEPWRFVFLTLDGGDAARSWRLAIQRLGPVIDLAADGPLLERLRRVLLDRYHRAEPASAWEDAEDAYGLTVALMHEVARHGNGEEDPRSLAIGRCVHHVQRHLAEDCDVATLAAVAGMSRAHFSRSFRELMGTPPGEYVISLRLEQARRLLATTHRSVREVATACGFADPNYFARLFRQRVGTTPLAYRSAR